MDLSPPTRITDRSIIPFTTVAQGTQNNNWTHHSCLAIFTQDELDWWWSRFERPGSPAKPTVTYGVDMLICILRGHFPRDGYLTAITNIIDAKSPVSLTDFRWVLVGQYDPPAPLILPSCRPYHIIRTAYTPLSIRPVYTWVLTDPRV